MLSVLLKEASLAGEGLSTILLYLAQIVCRLVIFLFEVLASFFPVDYRRNFLIEVDVHYWFETLFQPRVKHCGFVGVIVTD